MVDWFRSELGGVMLALLGYAARALVDETVPPWKTVAARVALAVICGVVAQVIMPGETPEWLKGAVLVLIGLCTKELVQAYMKIGLKRFEKEADRDPR